MLDFLLEPNVASAVIWILVAYAITSKICLEFPYLYQKKRQVAAKMGKRLNIEVIAHRGSRAEGLPENTLAAFEDAVQVGSDVIELDVWLTTDKRVIVHHDKCLTRMTSGKNTSLVIELAHSELPEIIPGDGQRERLPSVKNKSEWATIPELWQVLEAIQPSKACIIVEFKQDSDELIEKVKDQVRFFISSQSCNT